MSVSLTVAYVKEQFLTDLTRDDHDTLLSNLIEDVVLRAIDYIDDTTITDQSTLPSFLLRPLAKQVSYEYRRRNDVGLESVSYPDGSVNKFSADEWLRSTRTTLDRVRSISLGDLSDYV